MLVAAVGVFMLVVVGMGVFMRMRLPVGMGMLVGVHGFVVMHNSVPFRRRPEKDACQSFLSIAFIILGPARFVKSMKSGK